MAVPDMPELAVGSLVTAGTGYRIDYSLLGYLINTRYDYRSKYFFSASYRRDGSSRFAPGTRWGNFWSLGASWRIDREEFMQSATDWLSALTLKASYGAQGNDNLGTYYASSGLYSIVSQAGENALVSDRLATPALKWETNLNLNVGIDFHCSTTVSPVRSISSSAVPKTCCIPVLWQLPWVIPRWMRI